MVGTTTSTRRLRPACTVSGTRAVRPRWVTTATYSPAAARRGMRTATTGPLAFPWAIVRGAPRRRSCHRTRPPPPSTDRRAVPPAATGSSGPAATVPITENPVPGRDSRRVGGRCGGKEPSTSATLRTDTDTE